MSQEGHWGGPRRARVLKCGQSGQGGTGEEMRSPGKQGRGDGPLGHCGALALPLHNTRTTGGCTEEGHHSFLWRGEHTGPWEGVLCGLF